MRLLLLLAAMVVAPAAWAVNDWGYPGCKQSTSDNSVDSGRICFDFNTSFSTAYTSFSVTGPAALACLKTATTNDGTAHDGISTTAGTPAQAIVTMCPTGVTTSRAVCGAIACVTAGCTLTGLNDVPSLQKACVPLGPGVYRVDFPALPDDPDVGLFSVEGSDR